MRTRLGREGKYEGDRGECTNYNQDIKLLEILRSNDGTA